MTREAARKVLVTLGIPEPTEQQVTDYIESLSGEVNREKAKNATLKEQADKAAELQKKLDEIEAAKMTELQQATKRAEDAEAALLAANREKTLLSVTSIFAKAGLSGDSYAGAIKAFSNMKDDEAVAEATSFVEGIVKSNSQALTDAKAQWEKELLQKTGSPSGGNPGGKPNNNESAAAKFAKSYTEQKAAATPVQQEKTVPVNF